MHVKEKITYPKRKPLPGSNPCTSGCSSFEHVLACGHSVNTPGPGDVCGSNCWAVARSPANSTGKRTAGAPFWCDACIEEKIEADVEFQGNITAQQAENLRIELRTYFLIKNIEAQSQARKTYVGEKRVTLPIDRDNKPLRGYQAPKPKHPFEVGTLHAGRSFFEDIDPNPVSSARGAPSAATPSTVTQRNGNQVPTHSASSIVPGDRYPLPGTQPLWVTEDRFRRRRVLNDAAAPSAVVRQQPIPQIVFQLPQQPQLLPRNNAHAGTRNTSLRTNTLGIGIVDEDEITKDVVHLT
ncbi:hypothetical protein P171DRAFT_445324 [Karstenula rhodostoma CBS 690.94]|uniref:Uncharacterized protein n=1 Tax=Karstenula rhodostoma CBS 690.94 TaxID=1392251 RepID=A0A9P4UA22_9PLEO|nr:hypothetical protein P171DRAFT_445324 [Karstenula rhodostoma CBS 690.94]